jgi:hypothetical protein
MHEDDAIEVELEWADELPRDRHGLRDRFGRDRLDAWP